MSREEILDAAKKIVTGRREEEYGKPEDNFQMIANLWNDYLGIEEKEISSVDVAMMMALLKIARIAAKTDSEDSFIDLAGYASCGGEIALKSKSKSEHTSQKISIKVFSVNSGDCEEES